MVTPPESSITVSLLLMKIGYLLTMSPQIGINYLDKNSGEIMKDPVMADSRTRLIGLGSFAAARKVVQSFRERRNDQVRDREPGMVSCLSRHRVRSHSAQPPTRAQCSRHSKSILNDCF